MIITPEVRHFPPSGHVFPCLLLPSFFSVSLPSFSLAISLLWLVIICLILRTQLWLILIVFRFRILRSLFSGGEHVSSSLKNFLPMFVPTFLQYGMLNHVIQA